MASIDGESSNPEDLSQQEVISGLRPLVVWMSNSLELLQFMQFQLPVILQWRTQKEHEQDEDKEVEDLG